MVRDYYGFPLEEKTNCWLVMPQLDELSCSGVLFDSKYALLGVHGGSIAVVPRKGGASPGRGRARRYAAALSYAHEAPVIAYFGPEPCKSPSAVQRAVNKGRDAMDLAERAHSGRHKNDGWIPFQWATEFTCVDIALSSALGHVERDLLALYSDALLQTSPLSELVGYFRVLEAAQLAAAGIQLAPGARPPPGIDGRTELRASLSSLESFDFGNIWIEQLRNGERTRVNILDKLKTRALHRLKQLETTKGDPVQYLYVDLRCGIAHGKSGIKLNDFGATTQTVAKDCWVLRAAARIAISKRLKPIATTMFGKLPDGREAPWTKREPLEPSLLNPAYFASAARMKA